MELSDDELNLLKYWYLDSSMYRNEAYSMYKTIDDDLAKNDDEKKRNEILKHMNDKLHNYNMKYRELYRLALVHLNVIRLFDHYNKESFF
jgi:hypothetical protein